MPPPPPPLMDDLVEEILLRLPPASPASLVRAGLVCKRWCHLVSDPGFQRRFREFHRRAPPMVGFLTYSDHDDTTRFVPTSASGGLLPHTDHRRLKPGDSRHGRVLLHTTRYELRIVVWNPITGEQVKLPWPPRWHPCSWTAAVLCAAAAGGGSGCDHLDCHRGPFVVVLVGTRSYQSSVWIYSSEADAWSEPTIAPHSVGSIRRSVRSTLVGNNTLYFVLKSYKSILEYNLCTRRTTVIKLRGEEKNNIPERFGPIQLTTMEDDRLGFVRVENFSGLCIWSREDEEPAGWVLRKVIDLDKLLPLDDTRIYLRYLVGSAEDVGTIFLRLKDELFTVDLRSGRVTKVYTHQRLCFAEVVVPYVNFCTPVFRVPSTLVDQEQVP